MLRKLLIASVIAVTAAATIPTDASARGGRGGGGWHGGGGHWHGGGGWHGGWRGGGWGRGWGFYGPALGVGLYAPYAYGAYGCWRTVRVGTPYGWRWRRVWVCG